MPRLPIYIQNAGTTAASHAWTQLDCVQEPGTEKSLKKIKCSCIIIERSFCVSIKNGQSALGVCVVVVFVSERLQFFPSIGLVACDLFRNYLGI